MSLYVNVYPNSSIAIVEKDRIGHQLLEITMTVQLAAYNLFKAKSVVTSAI